MPGPKNKIDTVVLTIAGSDSCGGAGVQADLRTFKALGVYGASVITAITAQNTLAVHATQAVPAGMIAAQLEAVLDDLPVRAIKTGMLPDAAAIEAVSEILDRRCADLPLIVDPVLVATSGSVLTLEDTVAALRQRLFPLATLVTPNLAEARALAGNGDDDVDPAEAARSILALGCSAVLLKGGHGEADVVTDTLLTGGSETAFDHPNVAGDYHGTGCVLSSAIAARMAMGISLEAAVRAGIEHVQTAIANARRPLKGDLHLLF